MSMLASQNGSPIEAAPKLVLSSCSPRRTKLLDEHGYAHEVRSTGIDDSGLDPRDADPHEWVASLAYLKARAGADLAEPGSVIIGADTVCVHEGRIIGQPEDRDDAERIIRLFENAEHEVLTGVAILPSDLSWRDVFVDRSVVRVGTIGDERIEGYLETHDWTGKAGAYNLAERLDAGWPIEFTGDATSIMGLPMVALRQQLEWRGVVQMEHRP